MTRIQEISMTGKIGAGFAAFMLYQGLVLALRFNLF